MISKNILRKKRLTTVEVADILDMHQTSVINWIKEGSLAAHETPGGHRRVLISDLRKFAFRKFGKSLEDYLFPLEVVQENYQYKTVIFKKFMFHIGTFLAGLEESAPNLKYKKKLRKIVDEIFEMTENGKEKKTDE